MNSTGIAKVAALTVMLGAAVIVKAGDKRSAGSKIVGELIKDKIELTTPRVGVEVERVQLDNGLVVYLYENHRLPLFNVTSMIRCGSIWDAPEKNGLSGLVGTVMRTGGSRNIGADSLNSVLEYIGGSIETSIGIENGSASMSVLSRDMDQGLNLYVNLLRNPAFPPEKLELAKADLRNSIKRRDDNPGNITTRVFNSLLYGDHPYGRILEWTTVKGITSQDLVDYHRRFFTPENVLIGVSGDFNKQEVIVKLTKLLGDWARGGNAPRALPEVTGEPHPGVFLVRKDINQANISVGEIGIKRDNPDKYAVALLNYVLGGGSFTSRITSRVRSDEGLAYRANSRFDIDSRDFGVFSASCQTKSATAYKATKIMLEEIEKISSEGVTPSELSDAQDAAVNRFVFNFDTPGKIVQSLVSLEFNGFPSDYYQQYVDNVRKVTLADVKRVAGTYLKPDQLTFVVVGNPDLYETQFSEFGKITSIPLLPPLLD